MMRRITLDQYAVENDCKIVVLDGLDDALVGFAKRVDGDPVAVYSYGKILGILRRDMSYEEAVEYFDYNIAGLYAGENTPLILYSENDIDNSIITDGATV